MSNILITGDKGFIGHNLKHYLTQKGHCITGHNNPKAQPSLDYIDTVIHLGAISQTTNWDVEQVLQQNLDFSIELFYQTQRRHIPLQYASSASVYGGLTVFNESSAVAPLNPYAWSKYLFDRFIQSQRLKAPVTGFRYFNVYGPNETQKGTQASPVTQFSQQAKNHGTIKLFEGSDHCLRDFVSVYDLCHMHEYFIQHPTSGLFNAGTGKAVSFAVVAELIAKRFNARVETIPFPEHLKNQYQYYTCADMTQLNQIIKIDWMPIDTYINTMHDNLTLLQETICN